MASAVTIPPNMDTTLYRRNVLQGLKALNFDPTGRLRVDSLTASSADLTIIENLQIQSNALLTSQLNELIQIALNTSGGGGGGGLVTVTNFPSSQAVTNAGTFAVQNTDPTPAGANTIGYVNIKGHDNDTGQYVDIELDPNGVLYANIQSPLPAGTNSIGTVGLNTGTNFIGSVNPDSTGTGSVTSSTPLVVTVTNFGTLAFQSNAVATGNVTIEASVDGTTYTATTYTALTSGNTSSTFNAATATIGQIDVSGFKNIRFRSNTITAGSVGITYNLSKNVSNVMLDNPLPAGTNTIGAVTVTGVATAANQATEITSLASIATNTAKVAGFSIPTFDTKTFTYVSGTTNIQTVVYSLSGTTVATLTFNYTSGNLTSIVKS
jgi:hypothetical protein